MFKNQSGPSPTLKKKIKNKKILLTSLSFDI